MKILGKTKNWLLGAMLVTGLGMTFPACCNQDEPMDDGSDATVTFSEDIDKYFTEGWTVEHFSETRKFDFKTNHLWNIKIKYNEGTDWITVSPDKGSMGENRGFTVKVAENKYEEDRTAVLTLTAGQVIKKMLIKQNAVPPTPGQIIFDTKSATLFEDGWTTSYEAAKKVIKFETNKTWKVTTEYEDATAGAWCTIEPEKGDLGEDCSFTINLKANDKTGQRVVRVSLTAFDLTKTLVITQTGTDTPDPNRVLDPGGTSWMLFSTSTFSTVPTEDSKDNWFYFYSGVYEAGNYNKNLGDYPNCFSIEDSPWSTGSKSDAKGLAFDRTVKWQYISIKLSQDKYTNMSRWNRLVMDVTGQSDGQSLNQVYFYVYDNEGNEMVGGNSGDWTFKVWKSHKFNIPQKDDKGQPLDLSKAAEIRISPNGYFGNGGNFKYYFDNIRFERDTDLGAETK